MPTNIAFPWPYKGVNKGWPNNAQPSLSTPDALNVLTDEPQRGRARGGSRNGTKKAAEQQLGDGTSRRLSGLWQVTKLTVDEGTPGTGGGSGLYQLLTNQTFFADSTNVNAPMEDLYSGFTLGTDDASGAPLQEFYARFGDGRNGTWPDGVPLADGNASILAFQGFDDTGSVAVVKDSNYHANDNFLVELHGIVGTGSYHFLACRVKNGDIGTTTAVVTAQLEINAGLDTHTISLWKGTTLINAVTAATTLFGEYRLGIRLNGTTCKVFLNGATIFDTSIGSTSTTARGVAFGAYQEGAGGGGAFRQIRALQPTTGNDFGTLDSTDDLSAYATGQQVEATGPFNVGTMDYALPMSTTDQTDFLTMLNGDRDGTDPGDPDSGTVGDDGSPYIQTVNPAITLAGALVRRTGDLTPADDFEVRLPFDRDNAGQGLALACRIKSGDPTDSDGVITVRWRPSWQDFSVHADYVLFLGETVITRGAAPIHGIANGSIDQTTATLKLRVAGDQVSVLVDDYLVCTGTIGGQNTAARGVAFGAFSITDLGSIGTDGAKVRGLDVYVQDTSTGGAPGEGVRDTRLIAVAGEDVYSGTLGGPYTKIDNVRDTQRKPSLTDVNGLVYLVDGEDYIKVIDPIAVTADDLVASAGTVPGRCTIAVTWRGRLVVSGQEAQPQNIYMSEAGDPTDWNYSPGTPNALQAVALNASEAGRIGQPVIALVPFHDDVLVIGCDHGIYSLTGDPAAGGVLDAISEGIGFATRDGWCMSPDGVIYFVGTSGFYKMAAGGQPVNVALGKYQQYFQELDRASNYIMCVWDRDRVGCWIFVVPRVEGAESTHLWFDAKQEAFWPMRLPTVQGPLSAIVYDGDSPTDRYTLLGGHDGYIRRFDKEADQDDGVAIESYVFLGPINPGGPFNDAKIIETEFTTGIPTNGMDYELHQGEDAQAALSSTADFSGRFTTSGRQEKVRSRARGNTFLYRIGNTVISKAWVLERIAGVFEPSGRRR